MATKRGGNFQGDATAGGEFTGDDGVAGGEGADEIVEDSVGDGLGKRADVPEGMKVELEGFTFDATAVGGVADRDGGEIRLPGDRAEGGEFRRGEDDLVGTARFGIGKGFEPGLGRMARHRGFGAQSTQGHAHLINPF